MDGACVGRWVYDSNARWPAAWDPEVENKGDEVDLEKVKREVLRQNGELMVRMGMFPRAKVKPFVVSTPP